MSIVTLSSSALLQYFLATIQCSQVRVYAPHTPHPLTREVLLNNYLFMNKQTLAEKVHETIGCTKADAERAVEAIIDGIVEGVKKGGEVSVAGLGIFSSKMRPARAGRNPRTGESISIPAMRVPKFRAAKAFKDSVK